MTTHKKSTDYPRSSLPELIKKSRKIEGKYFSGEFEEPVIARVLGYNGVNGASIVYLSSLRRFGLLTEGEKKGNFKLSEKLKDLIKLDHSEPSYKALVEEVAFAPDIFFELRERFGKTLPKEEELKKFLVFKKFGPKAVPRLSRSYRETFEYVARERDDYVIPDEAWSENSDRSAPSGAGVSNFDIFGESSSGAVDNSSDKASRLEVNLAGLLRASVVIYGEVTQETIDKLIRFLEASKESFPAT
jgi:hypothetical protein